ncbi:FitA-like ribbon-helix-helix domain-containing protein [Streptoalloteichus hindustanus]|nr:antitoxin [Streptoalloteichus hindustanus]
MATIQIRDVPEEAYEVIRQRARAAGQSIQSYMREQVIEMARQRTKQEVLAEIEAALAEERPRNVTAESLAAHVAAERR